MPHPKVNPRQTCNTASHNFCKAVAPPTADSPMPGAQQLARAGRGWLRAGYAAFSFSTATSHKRKILRKLRERHDAQARRPACYSHRFRSVRVLALAEAHAQRLVENDSGETMDVFNPPLGAGCPSLDDDGDTKISTMWGTPSQLKNGRKAKRALRRRMKPKQRRCSDRMTGPTLEQRSREVPKLPPGADGLAAVSLRPSLAKQGQYAGVRAPMATYPRRPATASDQRHQAGKPQLLRDSTYSGGRRIKSSSAPPTATGSRDANAGESTDHQDDYEVLPTAGLEIHCPSETQEPLQPSQTYPLRPTVEKERTLLSYADVGQRTLRRRETSTPTGEGNQEDDDQEDYGRVVRCEEPRVDQGTTVVGQKGAYTAESELVTNPFFSTPQNAADYHPADGDCQSAGGQDRGATVVLSSTVLLSPRGRARTPTPSTAFAAEWRAISQDNEADWAYSLSPRPHTAQDSYFGGGSWHDPPTPYSSNARCEQRWAPSDAKSGQYGTSKVGWMGSAGRVGRRCMCTLNSRYH